MDDGAKLRAVRNLRVLDSPPDGKFDDLVALALDVTGAPMGCISIFDHDRVWFKYGNGFESEDVAAATALCSATLDLNEVFVSPNVAHEPRFTSCEIPENVQSYAAAPLIDRDGHRIGNLCLFDTRALELSVKQKESLARIGRQVAHHLNELEPETKASLQAREILESITDGFFTLDRLFNLTYLNDLALSQFAPGKRKQDLIGTNFWTLFPDAEHSSFGKNYRRCMEKREPVTFEEFYEPVNVWGEIRCYPNDSGISVFFKDITERKMAAIEKDRVFNLSPDLMCITEQGYFTRVNPAMVKLFGFTELELLSRPVYSFVHPDDLPVIAEARSRLNNQTKPVESLSRYICKDGTLRSISWQAVREGEKNYCVGRDITVLKKMEKIEASELKFRNLAESLPQIVFTSGIEGELTYLNGRWGEYTGLDVNDLSADAWLNAIHPDDVPAMLNEYAACMTENRSFEFRYRLKGRDGNFRWHLGRTVLIKDENGQIIQRIGTATDIHDQIKAQNSVLEFKQRADAIINNAPILLWACDVHGNFTFYEGNAQKALGITSKDRLGKNIFELYGERAEISGNTRRALTGETTKDQAQIGKVWMENTFVPLFDQNKQVVGVVGLSIDISDRKAEEIERKKSEELFHKSSWGIAISGPDFHYLQVNPSFAKLHGRSAESLVGKHVTEIFDAQSRADFYLRKEDYSTISRRTHEAVHVRADGTTFPSRVDVSVVYGDDGSVKYHIATVTDLTDSKTADRARDDAERERAEMALETKMAIEASRMKSDFLANMSHEIRTPINGIVGMSNLLGETTLTKEQRGFLSAITQSSESLLGIVNDVLDFSKIEAGKLEMEEIDFDLGKLLSGIESTMGMIARNKELSLSLELPADLPKSVRGDAGRLRQILNNLVSNAIKFTPTGHISVNARVLNKLDDGAVLQFEITDSGIGISESAKQRLFQPFNQADASTTRKFGGTGLGLSICKHLVEQFNGQIGVNSSEGKGSTFWFTARLKDGAPLSTQTAPKFNFNLREQLTWSPRVLIAEDNLVNQTIVMHLMKKMGLRAEAVVNGRQVLEQLTKEKYDLILMDCQMPEMDGYEATRAIRASRELAWAGIPIIALTANAVTGDREKCIAAGMNDYVSKPIEFEDLARAMLACFSIGPADMSEGPLDRETIENLDKLDPTGNKRVLKDVIKLFRDETPDRAAAIRQGLQENNPQRVMDEAHSLKSSSALLGAKSLSLLAAQIEERGRQGNMEAAAELMFSMEAQIREVFAGLDSIAKKS